MKKMPEVLKDGLVGIGIGVGLIIPGISGATIALVFGKFKTIVNAVSGLLSKLFIKNLLILLPFAIGAILAVLGLIKPFQLAFEYCMFAIVCLFAAFIVGSFPGILDNVKGKPVKPNYIVLSIVGFLVAAAIGVIPVIVRFPIDAKVADLFNESPFYLYLILFGVGIIGAAGLTVPGFSASMLLLVIGFYKPILNTVKIDIITGDPGKFFGVLGSFVAGVAVGFFLLSYLMNYLLDKHALATHYTIIGFIAGSLIAIFINTDMFNYLETKANLLDWILAPIFIVIGIILAYLLVRVARKHSSENEEEAPNNA